MKIGNLFNNTPAWQHTDPKQRTQAITQLSDLALLQQIFREESDKTVRKHALTHYQNLMLGHADNSPALTNRLTALQHDSDVALLEQFARHGAEIALRRAAINKLDRPALLTELILQETDATLQQDILTKLNDAKSLEKLSAASRTHNKTLHRQAETKLEALKIAAGDPNTIQQKRQAICTAIEQLTTDAAALDELSPLQAAWAELPNTADKDSQTRFERACRLFQRLHQAKEALRNPPAPEPPKPDATDITTSPAPTNPALLQLCQRAKNLLSTDTPLKPKTLTKLHQDWQQLQPSIDKHDTAAQQLRTQLGQLDTRLQAETQAQKDQQTALKTQLQALQTQIDEGHIQAAREGLMAVETAFNSLPKTLAQPLQDTLNQIRRQTQDLAGWQHWGNNQERLKLCAEIEALIGSDDSPPTIAKQIQTLQQRWKALEASEKIADDKRHASARLWRRFQRANNKAYEPCKIYFTEQANAREAHLKTAEQLCEQLEAISTTENTAEKNTNTTPDWKAHQKQLQHAQRTLREMHKIPRQAQSQLRKRLNAAIAPLQTALADEHARVARRKQHLLTQAETLTQGLDTPEQLASAIKGIQDLQKQWKDSGSTDRKTETALWQDFRKHCDAVFATRNQQRTADNAQKKALFSTLEKHCQAIAALAQNTSLSLPDYRAQLQKHTQEWAQATEQQRAPEKLHKRFQQALKHCQQQLRQQEKAAAQQTQQHLREKAHYCATWEAHESASIEALTQAEAHWQTLPRLDSAAEQCLQARFKTVMAELKGESTPDMATRAKNLQQLNTLCIQLELALGVESPAEAQAERMQLQVARLSQALQGGNQQSTQALERDIYLLGPISPNQWPSIEQRLARLHNR